MNKNYKWIVLALLSCAFFFHQADRVLFGLLTIPIQDELHLTDLQIGWINTSLFCTLAVTTPLAYFFVLNLVRNYRRVRGIPQVREHQSTDQKG